MLMLWLSAVGMAAPTVLAWDESQHVYVAPEAWLPGQTTTEGLQQLEAQAQGLHHPFYVLLIRGQDLPGGGRSSQRLSALTETLFQSWERQGLDREQASIFAVAWDEDCAKPSNRRPRSTVCAQQLFTGTSFVHGPANLLPSRDHEALIDLFVQQVTETPQQPLLGIQAVMTGVDEWIWSRTNPDVLSETARDALTTSLAETTALHDTLPAAQQVAMADSIAVGQRILETGSPDEMHSFAQVLINQLVEAHRQRDTALLASQALARLRAQLDDKPGALPESIDELQDTLQRGEAILRQEEDGTPEDVLLQTEQALQVIADHRAAASRAQNRTSWLALLGWSALVLAVYSLLVWLWATKAREGRKKAWDEVKEAEETQRKTEKDKRFNAVQTTLNGMTELTETVRKNLDEQLKNIEKEDHWKDRLGEFKKLLKPPDLFEVSVFSAPFAELGRAKHPLGTQKKCDDINADVQKLHAENPRAGHEAYDDQKEAIDKQDATFALLSKQYTEIEDRCTESEKTRTEEVEDCKDFPVDNMRTAAELSLEEFKKWLAESEELGMSSIDDPVGKVSEKLRDVWEMWDGFVDAYDGIHGFADRLTESRAKAQEISWDDQRIREAFSGKKDTIDDLHRNAEALHAQGWMHRALSSLKSAEQEIELLQSLIKLSKTEQTLLTMANEHRDMWNAERKRLLEDIAKYGGEAVPIDDLPSVSDALSVDGLSVDGLSKLIKGWHAEEKKLTKRRDRQRRAHRRQQRRDSLQRQSVMLALISALENGGNSQRKRR